MTHYDQAISNALEKRRDDPAAQTQFAVSAIHHIAQMDEMASLKKETCVKLFEVLAQDPNLYSYSCKYESLFGNRQKDEKKYPRNALNDFAQACSKLSPHFDLGYSASFKQGISDALFAGLLSPKFEGKWSQAKLQPKVDYLDHKAFAFLDCYDPQNIIHKNKDYPQERIVGIDHTRVTEKYLLRFQAQHDFKSNMILFYNHVAIFFSPDYIAKHKPECDVDFEATLKLTDEEIFRSSGFHHDASYKDICHLQTIAHEPNVQRRCYVAKENKTLSLLAHELFHLCAFRLCKHYEIDPEYVEKNFGFTKTDYLIHRYSLSGYTTADVDMEAYWRNKEEIAARDIQNCTERTLYFPHPPLPPQKGDWDYSPQFV